MTERLTPECALAELAAAGGPEFVSLFRHGSLVSGETRRPFGPGEVLFAPAGVVHRFEEFTTDFATWVFFYGPEGGEQSPSEPEA